MAVWLEDASGTCLEAVFSEHLRSRKMLKNKRLVEIMGAPQALLPLLLAVQVSGILIFIFISLFFPPS